MEYNFKHIVLQPTGYCNLNCSYCYLPNRDKKNEMSIELAEIIATDIEKSFLEFNRTIHVLWHCGEPLTIGIEKFTKLIEPFEKLRKAGVVKHDLQTNGTLINDEWCNFFKKYKIAVGLSIDGNKDLNKGRVNWNGKEMYDNTRKGIEILKEHNIQFDVISVVHFDNYFNAKEFYDFFIELGCKYLCINIAEKEGINSSNEVLSYNQSKTFWQSLYNEWTKNPKIKIREFDRFYRWSGTIFEKGFEKEEQHFVNIWPTVAYDGSYCIISPELQSISDIDERKKYIIGNIYTGKFLDEIKSISENWYLKEYIQGKLLCRKNCAYYSFCGGGHAGNKYFELGTVGGQETKCCINTKKALIDALI